jgi:hypothetical protein
MRSTVLALGCALVAASALAAEDHGGHAKAYDPIYDYLPQPKIDYPSALAGKTLNAVAYLPLVQPQPVARGAGAASLRRVMFQAYLAPGGEMTVHSWNLASASYTAVARTRWSLNDKTLCLDMTEFAPEQTRCFEIHIWGPNVAGTGITGGGMLKGDLKPGNELGAR